MTELNEDKPRQNKEGRWSDTDKAFKAIKEAEDRQRLEKTMRLRALRLVEK